MHHPVLVKMLQNFSQSNEWNLGMIQFWWTLAAFTLQGNRLDLVIQMGLDLIGL